MSYEKPFRCRNMNEEVFSTVSPQADSPQANASFLIFRTRKASQTRHLIEIIM
jgi:hypothetical protein